jgi:hypothetical protein
MTTERKDGGPAQKPSLSAGSDPTQPFFLAVSITRLDGSLDELGGEGVEGLFATEQEAVDTLRNLNDDYPTLEGYVFHCIPVKRIWRGNTRVSFIGSGRRRQKGGA